MKAVFTVKTERYSYDTLAENLSKTYHKISLYGYTP
jgi:hypothetical protein